MKIYFFKLSLAILLGAALFGKAQAQGQRMEGIRIAYITQDLSLTTSQAEKFWPLFNEFSSKKKALQMRLRNALDRALSESAADAEIYTAVDEIMSLRKQESDLLIEYIPKFKTVITAKQLGRLITIEKRLAKEIIRRRGGGRFSNGASPESLGD